MKKTIGELIDELTITNIKIYHLINRVLDNEHSREDAMKIQKLNRYRSELKNELNKEFKQREEIKT